MTRVSQTAARVVEARRHGMATRRRRVPNARLPTLIESDYGAALAAIVGRMRTAARHVLDDLPSILGVREDDETHMRGRRARRLMERVRAEAEGAVNETALEGLAEGVGKRVSRHQRAELSRQAVAGLGVDVVTVDASIGELIAGFVHENVALIKSLQGRTLDHLETMITRAVASGTRAEELKDEIAERFAIGERHARLIARDQIGKLNSRITTARHTELGIADFEWQSMRDQRVRPRHRVLNGQRFSYAKPPAEGVPGMPIACRCLQKPVFDSIYAELDALGV